MAIQHPLRPGAPMGRSPMQPIQTESERNQDQVPVKSNAGLITALALMVAAILFVMIYYGT